MSPDHVLRGRVVTPDAVLDDGVVVVDGDRLAWVGPADVVPAELGELPPPDDVVLLPGLVDLHCHGGGGVGFPDVEDEEDARRATHEHLAHGTTSLVASLVTADRETLLARASTLGRLVASGDLVGVHVEGPFLSPARCGAQDPDLMTRGATGLVRELAQACGALVSMTVAPEVDGVCGADGRDAQVPGGGSDGADGVLGVLVDVGAIPSIGHTDASAEVTEAALALARSRMVEREVRGRRPTVTHLFNGMPPFHHRAPGPVAPALAAAARGDVVVELVGDGVHVAPALLRAVVGLVGADGVALVSDAIGATGAGDGEHRLGTRAVVVQDGVARLADGGALAGSTAHLLDVVRATVAAGVPLVDAVRAASGTPADVLGLRDVGALVAGRRADVVVVDPGLRPLRVLRAGRLVPSVRSAPDVRAERSHDVDAD